AAASATRLRCDPSNSNGLVTTPIVSAPCSRALAATIGAAPDPVPPPRPAVTNTRSAPATALPIHSASSWAARRPTSGSPPEPSPPVVASPIRIFRSAVERRRAWASVLKPTKLTGWIPALTIRSTALLPPPPTPTTRIARVSGRRIVRTQPGTIHRMRRVRRTTRPTTTRTMTSPGMGTRSTLSAGAGFAARNPYWVAWPLRLVAGSGSLRRFGQSYHLGHGRRRRQRNRRGESRGRLRLPGGPRQLAEMAERHAVDNPGRGPAGPGRRRLSLRLQGDGPDLRFDRPPRPRRRGS